MVIVLIGFADRLHLCLISERDRIDTSRHQFFTRKFSFFDQKLYQRPHALGQFDFGELLQRLRIGMPGRTFQKCDGHGRGVDANDRDR